MSLGGGMRAGEGRGKSPCWLWSKGRCSKPFALFDTLSFSLVKHDTLYFLFLFLCQARNMLPAAM